MYEPHFGLKKRPFRTDATGTDVFVSPQTAEGIVGIGRALTAPDAVIAVSGPVGSGKTTFSLRSLNAIGVNHQIIQIGRMHLDSGDVLDLLLEELGVRQPPKGTIQKFTAFRQRLKELEDAGTRIFIVVEDAIRIAADTLAELEALTAADAGASDGANIVLMGDERLDDLLQNSQLARLRQRIRQRHTVPALGIVELRGYLVHCFRQAGGNFESIFDERTVSLLYKLSYGIPRIVNNLVESSLAAAADQGLDTIPATLVASTAADEFGLQVENFDFSSATAARPIAELVAELDSESEEKPDAEPEVAAEIEPEPESDEKAASTTEVPADVADANDLTLPNLEILVPGLEAPGELSSVTGSAVESEPMPEVVAEVLPELAPKPAPVPSAEILPELAPEPAPEPSAEILPELAPEPAPEPSAEILPELALEPAPMAENQPELQLEPEPEPEPIAEALPEVEPEPIAEALPEVEPEPIAEALPEVEPEPIAEALPEVELEPSAVSVDLADDETPECDREATLAELKPDLDALEQAMAFAHSGTLDEPDPVIAEAESPAAEENEEADVPAITLDAAISTKIETQDAERHKIEADIANAKSIEEFDDKMAETLFGAEISMIAAQIVSNPPVDESANDATQGEEETAASAPVTPAAPKPSNPVIINAPEEVSLETQAPPVNNAMALSATQRLKTVRALNANKKLSSRKRPPRRKSTAEPASEKPPESIEDQINTSITQTVQALKLPDEVLNDEPEEPTKKGFFGRFRRS